MKKALAVLTAALLCAAGEVFPAAKGPVIPAVTVGAALDDAAAGQLRIIIGT